MSNKNKRNYNEKIIENFSNEYLRKFDFYNAASLLAAQLIEAQLIKIDTHNDNNEMNLTNLNRCK